MLRTELNDALKEAMKAKEQRAVATLRLILAGLKDRDIQARSSLRTSLDRTAPGCRCWEDRRSR